MKQTLLFLAVLCFVTLTSVAQNGTVKGEIKNLSGKTVSGAIIFLQGRSINASSDASGKFELTNVPAGSYTLVVRHGHYAEKQISINVQANSTTNVSTILNNKAGQFVNFWKNTHEFNFGFGAVMPKGAFKESDKTGMFAENGFQFIMEYNYHTPIGLFVGGGIEYDAFRFNQDAFSQTAGTTIIDASRWGFFKFGGNLGYKIPLIFNNGKFVINLYGEANGGTRIVSMPLIKLSYTETQNRYIEVEYTEGRGTMEYYGYSAGIQTVWNKKFGLNASYNEIFGGPRKVKYIWNGMNPQGEWFYEPDYLGQEFSHYGIQFTVNFFF